MKKKTVFLWIFLILSVTGCIESSTYVPECNVLVEEDVYSEFFDVYKLATFGQCVYGLALCDIDSNGFYDVVCSSATLPFNESNLVIFYNQDGRRFYYDKIFSTNKTYIKGVSANDYDLDGDIDILVSYDLSKNGQYTNGIFKIMWNNGEGVFTNPIDLYEMPIANGKKD